MSEAMSEFKSLIAELIESGAEITFSRYTIPDMEPMIRIDALWRQAHKEAGCLLSGDSWALADWEPAMSLKKMLTGYRGQTI